MSFDEIGKIMDGIADSDEITDAEKNSFEYTLTAAAELGGRYENTAYAVPFPFINFNLIANQFRSEGHPAFSQRRTKQFDESEFKELEYGATEDQPNFSQVFADFLNVNYASVIYQFIEEMQQDKTVETTFNGEEFVYSLTENAPDDELHELVIDYANIFL